MTVLAIARDRAPMVEGKVWHEAKVYDLGAYNALPECVKVNYTPEQYAWMSDADRETLIQRETEPEDE